MSAVVGPVVVVLCLTVLTLTTWGGWWLYAAGRARWQNRRRT